MKKAEKKKEPVIKSGFRMTDEQHCELTDMLFQVESAVRVIIDRCVHENPQNAGLDEKFTDIANILTMAEDKLKFAQRVLDK